VKTLHFDSEAGMPQYDPVTQRCTSISDKNIFAVIDPATDEVVGRYPVGAVKGSRVTLTQKHHRGVPLVRRQRPNDVFNLDTHQPIALPQWLQDGRIKFDPGLKRIYLACSSGAISVFQMDDPDH